MPPLVVMRPCAVLEEGHAWSRGERGLKARQPLAAKGRDKQVRPRSSLELFFLETTLFSFRPSAASSFHSNRFSFSTVSRSLLSSTSTMGGGNAQKSAISRAKNAAKAASAGKGTPLRREREKKGLIHFFLQAVEAAPPPILSFSPSSSLTASSSSSSSSLQQPKKKNRLPPQGQRRGTLHHLPGLPLNFLVHLDAAQARGAHREQARQGRIVRGVLPRLCGVKVHLFRSLSSLSLLFFEGEPTEQAHLHPLITIERKRERTRACFNTCETISIILHTSLSLRLSTSTSPPQSLLRLDRVPLLDPRPRLELQQPARPLRAQEAGEAVSVFASFFRAAALLERPAELEGGRRGRADL